MSNTIAIRVYFHIKSISRMANVIRFIIAIERGRSVQELVRFISRQYGELTAAEYGNVPRMWDYRVEESPEGYLENGEIYLVLTPTNNPLVWKFVSDYIPSLAILLDIILQIGRLDLEKNQLVFKERFALSSGVMTLLDTEEWRIVLHSISRAGAIRQAVITADILNNIDFLQRPTIGKLPWR